MSAVLIQLNQNVNLPETKPKSCPTCGGHAQQQWDRFTQPIKENTSKGMVIKRYRCVKCGKIFRDYPNDQKSSLYNHGIRSLIALLSALGMEDHQIINVFQEYGIHLSDVNLWREGITLKKALNGREIYVFKCLKTRKEDVFQLYSKLGVVLALDLGTEDYLVLGVVNEHDPASVVSWLVPLVKGTNFNVMRLNTGPFVFNQHFMAT
jgi:hypothetical protein